MLIFGSSEGEKYPWAERNKVLDLVVVHTTNSTFSTERNVDVILSCITHCAAAPEGFVSIYHLDLREIRHGCTCGSTPLAALDVLLIHVLPRTLLTTLFAEKHLPKASYLHFVAFLFSRLLECHFRMWLPIKVLVPIAHIPQAFMDRAHWHWWTLMMPLASFTP